MNVSILFLITLLTLSIVAEDNFCELCQKVCSPNAEKSTGTTLMAPGFWLPLEPGPVVPAKESISKGT
ncbi:hypothetical protein QR680_006285 [Steinernema hermaphroditum]|uniref:Uncharacterized protein n=1 Tax=Steinernema hermaphroditum TaxID=289476 RepID=A0AA39LWV5_9BILA|nr:hypothetical protein QR680_006285 [Steinernema hermaphroditum]